MRIDRRLTFVGIMLIVLSMTMATQYASTKIGFSYSIVHPSNADIRFVASDNSSDGYRVLRSQDLTNKTYGVELVFGNRTENQNKSYTAAFCIVNEEQFSINITHINVSTDAGADYIQIWLHGNRTKLVDTEAVNAKAYVWNRTTPFNADSCVWVLGAGNGQPWNMQNGSTSINTLWDTKSYVRWSESNQQAINGSSDFVWVQISINVPDGADLRNVTGQIWIHFKATTNGII